MWGVYVASDNVITKLMLFCEFEACEYVRQGNICELVAIVSHFISHYNQIIIVFGIITLYLLLFNMAHERRELVQSISFGN